MMLMFNNGNGGLGGTRGTGTGGLLLGGGGTTSTKGKMTHSDEDDIQYDDEDLEPHHRRGDSPDFNRGDHEDDDEEKSNLTSTTYDLTVSANAHQTTSQRVNTDELSANPVTGVSLLTANNQSKTVTSTNRTFADSVLNHQYN